MFNHSQFWLIASLVLLISACVAGAEDENKSTNSNPTTPTGVTATAGSARVTLSWNAVSDASSYNIYMATQSGVTKSNTLAGGMTHSNAANPYVHTGLTNGTPYYFVVTAVNSSGESAESTEASATPQNLGTWNSKTSMPTARAFLSTGVVSGVLYAVGGSTGIPNTSPTVFATVEAFDPLTNAWTTKAPMTTPRYGAAIGVVNGIVYAVGGWNGGPLATVEAYDPVTNIWTTKTPMTTARGWLAAGVVNNILYAVGGFNAGEYATVEAYDPVTNTWTTKTPMPTARSSLAVGVVNGILYAIGGGSTGGSWVEAYDPVTNTWTTKTPMPTARYNLAVGVIDGIVYAMGGLSPAFTTAVEAYNPATNTWTTKTPMSIGRQAPAADVVNGALYVVGGLSSATTSPPLATSEAFTLFDGAYTGSWSGGQSNGATLTGTLTLTISNGVVTGDTSPISGSTRTISGTMSTSGAITATIPSSSIGCGVSLTGQVTLTSSGGTTAAGTYSLIASSSCNSATGTWTAI